MIFNEYKIRSRDFSNSYESIRNEIEMGMDEDWRSLMITSPTLINDQHMVAVNIASVFSKEGKKVLLINTQNKSLSIIKQIVDKKQGDYDHILFHSGDYLSNIDIQRLTNACDGVVLILQEKVTKKADMQKAKTLLLKGRAELIGTIYQRAPKFRVRHLFRKGRKALES